MVNDVLLQMLESDMHLCIYCLGAYGMRTYLRMRDYGIQVDCFGDRDKDKHGYVLDGIECLPFEQIVEKDKEKTWIVVCNEQPEQIMDDFLKRGFVHVLSYGDVGPFEDIQYSSIDYTEDDIISAVNLFRKQIYNCYLENKLICSKMPEGILYRDLENILENTRVRMEKNR